MDLERELTRVLRAVEVPPAADPVSAVRAGMQRRQRVRRVQAAAAGLAVVAVAVGASTLLGDDSSRTRITPLPGASATAPPPTESAAPAPAPTKSDLAVPVGFQGADLSWVSVDDGFAVVSASCGSDSCSRLLATHDGGRTWSEVPATGLPQECATSCPLRVRFANRDVGYAYGDGLVMTTDGGRTWTKQPGPDTHGLEIAGGTAVRVVELTACPGCRFAVQRSQVASSTWQTVYSSDELKAAADLVRQGEDVAVALQGNPAGGASDAHSALVVSEDAGSTWTRHDDPCGGTGDEEWDAAQLTWSQDHQLVVLCRRRLYRSNGGNESVMLSSDAGRTFSRPVSFGEVTDVRVVTAGRGVLLAETHYGIDREVVLQRSTDGGQTWSEVARAPLPTGSATGYLAFSTSTIATWVPPGGTEVRRSTDDGQTWTAYPLR